MNPDQKLEEQLFRDALARAAGPERKGFLDGVCGDDSNLRQRLDALLRAHENPGSALERGAGILPGPPAATIKLSFPDDPAPLEGPGTVIGRYRILEQIGEGGFGAVYVAEQREPVKRRVALKVIKLGMDTKQVVARFEAERQALAMMDHPNIAKVLDAGATETGRPYFVMELVRGIPITAYCDENSLDTQQRLGLFIQVCQAVQHAHQKGIIHRDLKPSNILVTLHDGVPVPMVIDFGIAKAMHGELTDKTVYTQFQQFIGTPAYVSPEQAEMSALDIDTRADIYSLGVLLYELLTGRVPFEAKELLEAGVDEMRRILREREPARPSTRLGKMTAEELTTTAKRRSAAAPKLISVLRGDLDWVVMKCLEKDRTRRYDSASNLANDIQHHLASEPVNARPPSKVYRFQKAWRRNQLAFTAGAAVVAALVIGIGISAWQAVVATRARSEAVQSETKAVAAQREAEKSQQAEKQARLRADAEKEEAAHSLYVADMSLAQQAWEANNMGRLRQLLEFTKDSPHRGFEWYYWQKQTHLAWRTLRGHFDKVLSVACSPNGPRIVTGSFDGTAKVWELSRGIELFALKGHIDKVSAVAFSSDGKRIVTGGWDGTARVWDAANGRALFAMQAQSGPVYSVAFSPDGQRIVTGCSYGTVKVWDTATGQELLELGEEGTHVTAVAFSPDGRRIVTCSGRSGSNVRDAVSGRELLVLSGHKDEVVSVAFSPDGQRIITGSEDRTAKVWDAGSGRELLTLKGHSANVSSVAFSSDGQLIVTGSEDGTAKLWELPGSIAAGVSQGSQLTLKGHKGWVWAVTFSPDGQRIATGSSDGTAKIWEAASGRELLSLRGHQDEVGSVAFSPGGERIATGSNDKTAKVWEAASGRELLVLRGHEDKVISASFSPDGQRIVTGSNDKTAKVWEAASGRELLALRHSETIT